MKRNAIEFVLGLFAKKAAVAVAEKVKPTRKRRTRKKAVEK